MNGKLNMAERSKLLRQHATLGELYALTAENGDRVASAWLENGQERTLTFAQLDRIVKGYASYLADRLADLPQGSFVAIAMDTCVAWYPAFWGLTMAGYNALLLDASLSPDMTAYMLAQGGAKAILCEKHKALPAEVTQILKSELESAPEGDFTPRFADSVALCTSGTTATSRIFVYDQQALCEQVLTSDLIARQNRRMIDDVPKRSLAFLPFHHVFGFMACLLWCGFLGYTNVYLHDRTPQTIVDTANRFRINLLIAVPLLAANLSVSLRKRVARQPVLKRWCFGTMKNLSLCVQRVMPEAGIRLAKRVLFKRVLNQLLGDQVDCIILGGSHTPAEHLKTLTALGYYTVCGFGMTETAITSVETSMKLSTRLSGSVGRPLESVAYRVTPSQEGDDSRGEMAIRGSSIHTGRLVDGVLTGPDTDAEGWYHTGDVVRLEKGGRMYVEGRIKEIIINESGENVYPDELEDIFARLEGVEQLSVLGVPRSECHEPFEDIVLVMNVGERFRDEAFLNRVADQVSELNSRQSVNKRLNRVLVTSSRLPAANGVKVKRAALRTLLQDRAIPLTELDLRRRRRKDKTSAVKPAADPKELIRAKVRELYASALEVPVDTLHDDDHFIDDLGGDSLQVLSIAVKAEDMFGVMIPAEEYGDCVTINSMTDLIVDRMNGVTRLNQTAPVAPITRFEDSPEYQAFHKRQEALMHAPDDNPYFVCHESPLTDVSLMDGHEVLNFGSYNYVGMSGRKEVEEAAKAAIDKYGTSASGSRLLAGEKKLYQELERELAAWKHAEDCLVLVGGHSTNVTVVGNFCGERDLIVYDALAHNSIEQGCRLSRAMAKPFPHNDPDALETILRNQRRCFEKVLIVIEGAYSMDGDVADVPAFVRLKKKYGCFLMVDEAHSACVLGENGGGVDEYFHLEPNDIDIKMGTLSKGLGACGGYLAGSTAIIEYLRYNLPGFVFSVGISPPLAAATLKSVQLLREDPSILARLRRNIRVFLDEAHKRGLDTCLAAETAIVPILVGGDDEAFRLSNALRRAGVFAPPAVYPAVPKGKARLRFCVISEHQPEQIVRALDILVAVAAQEGIELPRMAA